MMSVSVKYEQCRSGGLASMKAYDREKNIREDDYDNDSGTEECGSRLVFGIR